jgi:hypothetical protein
MIIPGLDILPRYRQIRAVARRLHDKELFERLPKDAFPVCGKRLGILRGNTFVLNTMNEMGVLVDYCLYDYRPDGMNAIERYAAQAPYPADSDEAVILRAAANALYSLFQVRHIIAGLGVTLRDALRDQSVFIVDEGFSRTAVPGAAFAGRIISLPDFSMTTGAALPLDALILDRLIHEIETRWGRAGTFDLGSLSREEQSEFSAMAIRCALAGDASSRIRYLEPGERAMPRAQWGSGRLPIHVRPNAPCPCGSGKKFKKCCRHG